MMKSLKANTGTSASDKQNTAIKTLRRRRETIGRLSPARRRHTTERWCLSERQVQSQGVSRLQCAAIAGAAAEHPVVAGANAAPREISRRTTRAAGYGAGAAERRRRAADHLDQCGVARRSAGGVAHGGRAASAAAGLARGGFNHDRYRTTNGSAALRGRECLLFFAWFV